MRRVINGTTYNTETSTLIATSSYDFTEERGPRGTLQLFQSRGGAFFLLDSETNTRRDRHGEIYEDERFIVIPKTRDEAHEWVMSGEVDLHSDVFGEPPEAEDTQAPEATIYARIPLSLKSRVETLARAKNQSLNAYVLRCLEQCAGQAAS